MKHRSIAPYILTLLFALAAAGLRIWSLSVAVDDQGLPVMHLSVYLLIGTTAAFSLLALLMALRSPGRSGNYRVLGNGMPCSIMAAIMILLGAVVEFAEALMEGPTIFAPVMCLLGIVGGICFAVTAGLRHREDRRYPAAEILPILYLLVKLVLNFKEWSTDPIILDYGFTLFALIFSLLAFYMGAGFLFDVGRPRGTLFCAMEAVVFCGTAMADGIMDLRFSAIITYGGFLLWQLPVIYSLLAPNDPDPAPEPPEQSEKRSRSNS